MPFIYDPVFAVDVIKSYPGFTRKGPIGPVLSELGTVKNAYLPVKVDVPFGDDAAVLEVGPPDKREGYCSMWVTLLAADGMMGHLVETDPYFAGYASVLVNVNDIAAMGGLPVALVDVVASGDEEQMEKMVHGMRDGSRKFGIPVVGGHTHPDGVNSLSVAVYGIAHRGAVIDSFHANPGMRVVMAMDINGKITPGIPYSWDTTTMKTAEDVQAQIKVMYELANAGLVKAAKDLSNPGCIGTLAMLCETSCVGAIVNLDMLPRPDKSLVEPYQWLTVYQGFGFVLAVEERDVDAVIEAFGRVEVEAADVGMFIDEGKVHVMGGGKQETLIDIDKEGVTRKYC